MHRNKRNNIKYKAQKGFTLVELLIVVSVIGVLFAVTLSVINLNRVRGSARDGVRMANLEKLVTALESYISAENLIPANHADLMRTDASAPHKVFHDFYLDNYPVGLDDQGKEDPDYDYTYIRVGNDYGFIVKSSLPDSCFKYLHSWGNIRNCKSSSSCSTSSPSNSCEGYVNPAQGDSMPSRPTPAPFDP